MAYRPPLHFDADVRDTLLAQWHAKCRHANEEGTQVCATHRSDLPCPVADSLLPLIREVREDERDRLMAGHPRPLE